MVWWASSKQLKTLRTKTGFQKRNSALTLLRELLPESLVVWSALWILDLSASVIM